MTIYSNPCGAATTWVVWANSRKTHLVLPIFGLKSPKNAQLVVITVCLNHSCRKRHHNDSDYWVKHVMGREQAFPSLTRNILKFAYYRNYCADYNQILHSRRDRKKLLVGGPNRRETNPKWRTTAMLKIEIRLYLRNGFADSHKFDANWAFKSHGQVKFRTFKNSRCQTIF